MSLQKMPPDRTLTFAERHPVTKQIWDDTLKVSKEEVVAPGAMTIGTFITSYVRGEIVSFRSAALWLLVSVLAGVLLYLVINIVRAPFIVIARHHKQIDELNKRLVDVEARPQISSVEAQQLLASTVPLSGQPNLVCLDARLIAVTDNQYVYEEFIQAIKRGVAIVDIRNAVTPPRLVSEAASIRAHIEYSETGGSDRFRVNNGCWLKEKFEMTSFAIGETKSLIIAQRGEPDKKTHHRALEHHLSYPPFAPEGYYSPESKGLTGKQYNVKVEITGGLKGEVYEEINLLLTLEPEFTIEVV